MKTFSMLWLMCIVGFSGVQAVAAEVGHGDLPGGLVVLHGMKYPNSFSEGTTPVPSQAFTTHRALGGFDELVNDILPSPDQDEAGSCLYMATTGIAEWWYGRFHPTLSMAPDGPRDLSERYLMNLSGDAVISGQIANWRTDTALIFNVNQGKAALNRDYRFTKGWFLQGPHGVEASAAGVLGAKYGTEFNWVDDRHQVVSSLLMTLPKFSRQILYADPEGDQWDVGHAPSNIVTTVKDALRLIKAPVQVIYNHLGYWHAVVVFGFNDETSIGSCPFVEETRQYFVSEIKNLQTEISATTDPVLLATLEERLAKIRTSHDDLEAAYGAGGGCARGGVFFVRDSIYPDKSMPMYDYDKTIVGEEDHYNNPVILREYEWLRYLSNHAVSVTAVQ